MLHYHLDWQNLFWYQSHWPRSYIWFHESDWLITLKTVGSKPLMEHTLLASVIKVNAPCRVALPIRGPPLLLCSHTGGTPGPPLLWGNQNEACCTTKACCILGLEKKIHLCHTLLYQWLQCACTHAETNVAIGCMVILMAPTRLLSSPHYLLACRGNVEIWVQMSSVSCVMFSLCHWITWLVKHLSEWCCINQVYYYIFTHLFMGRRT